jgi:hypothetical protein
MMPVYYAALENRIRKDGVHEGLMQRRMMGDRGLVAPYVFAAKDGEDFVDRYVAAVQKNQMLTMLDRKGQDTELPRPMTFGELDPDSRTLCNLQHAASVSWNVCRIKPIVDREASKVGDIQLSNLLLEVRDMDVSRAAVPAIAGWLHKLTGSDSALEEAEMRLEALGVAVLSNPKMAGLRTVAALAEIEKSSRTLDTVFGDPAAGTTVRDAVRQVILPMLASGNDTPEALELWGRVATSQTPVFRSVAPASVRQFPHAGIDVPKVPISLAEGTLRV